MRLFKHAKVYPMSHILKMSKISKMSSNKIFLNDVCSICLKDLKCFSVLPCGHCFHTKCISKWINISLNTNLPEFSECPECPECPECRCAF